MNTEVTSRPIWGELSEWLRGTGLKFMLPEGAGDFDMAIRIPIDKDFDSLYLHNGNRDFVILDWEKALIPAALYYRKDSVLVSVGPPVTSNAMDHYSGQNLQGLTIFGIKSISDRFERELCQMIERLAPTNQYVQAASSHLSEMKSVKNYATSEVQDHLFSSKDLAKTEKELSTYHCSIPELQSILKVKLMSYLVDAHNCIATTAEEYMRQNAFEIRRDMFLQEEVYKQFREIIAHPESELLTRRKIRKAVIESGARTLSVEIRKEGIYQKEVTFTFHTETLGLVKDIYSAYYIKMQDRRKYFMLFGASDYSPKEIVRITFRRKTIYDNPNAGTAPKVTS